MSSNHTQWLVVTDLDGTLLDHDTYSYEAAGEAIELLHQQAIPVILNTSKTYAETLGLQQELGIDDPFIVESGSCLFLPRKHFPEQPQDAELRDAHWAITLGCSQQAIEGVLDKIETPGSSYTRLSQCTVEQAVALTGLTPAQAGQALAREFSEPLIWHADADAQARFEKQLTEHGLRLIQGGRFLHVLGDSDKGRAIKVLAKHYQGEVKTIILGDSANDAAMLAMADISVIVKSPANHSLQQLITPSLQTIQQAPQGWTEGIKQALLLINRSQT
jgi:mannosyl-3-phosphoglycerate phosphatase family protein